jgi:hypothetical protein
VYGDLAFLIRAKLFQRSIFAMPNGSSQGKRSDWIGCDSSELPCVAIKPSLRETDLRKRMENLSADQGKYFDILCTLLDDVIAENDHLQVPVLAFP